MADLKDTIKDIVREVVREELAALLPTPAPTTPEDVAQWLKDAEARVQNLLNDTESKVAAQLGALNLVKGREQ